MKATKKMVHVFWVDSMAQGGWRSVTHDLSMDCESVGFLVEKTKERLILAKNYAHGDNCTTWGDHMHIPMCAVTKIRYLK